MFVLAQPLKGSSQRSLRSTHRGSELHIFPPLFKPTLFPAKGARLRALGAVLCAVKSPTLQVTTVKAFLRRPYQAKVNRFSPCRRKRNLMQFSGLYLGPTLEYAKTSGASRDIPGSGFLLGMVDVNIRFMSTQGVPQSDLNQGFKSDKLNHHRATWQLGWGGGTFSYLKTNSYFRKRGSGRIAKKMYVPHKLWLSLWIPFKSTSRVPSTNTHTHKHTHSQA